MHPGHPGADAALFLDFDGTLVELAASPEAIEVHAALPGMIAQLRQALGGAVAIVSGRPLQQVAEYLNEPGLCIAGVHGSERRNPDGQVHRLPLPNLERAQALLGALCQAHPALRVENKPGAIALHYRQAPELEGLCVLTMEQAMRESEEMSMLHGKMVIEMKSQHAGKGVAVRNYLELEPFRGRTPWFVGDDVTDEAAFDAVQALGGIAVKVGAGTSVALHRLADPAAVRQWLVESAERLGAADDGAAR